MYLQQWEDLLCRDTFGLSAGMCFECSQNTFWVSTGHILGVHWTHFECPQNTFWVSTGHILGVHWTRFECPQDMFWVSTGRVLSVPSLQVLLLWSCWFVADSYGVIEVSKWPRHLEPHVFRCSTVYEFVQRAVQRDYRPCTYLPYIEGYLPTH